MNISAKSTGVVRVIMFHVSSLLAGKKGDCTITITDSNFMDLVSGKLGPQKVSIVACMRVLQ